MKETWLVAELHSKHNTEEYHSKFMEFLGKLWNANIIANRPFYFFHEDWDYTKNKALKKLLEKQNRIRLSNKKHYFLLNIQLYNYKEEQEFKQAIKNFSKEITCKEYGKIVNKIKFDKQNGEIKNYSKRGWIYVKNYFWAGSLIALGFNDKRVNGKWYNTNKFVHCFLNQLNINEFSYHLDRVIKIGYKSR